MNWRTASTSIDEQNHPRPSRGSAWFFIEHGLALALIEAESLVPSEISDYYVFTLDVDHGEIRGVSA